MLTGCAVFIPTVAPKTDRPTKLPVSLQQGIDYAESAKDAYQSALRQYGLIPNVLALTVIPLAAATLGFGLTGANTKTITELGLITGAGLALGGWFQNKPRERVYNTGFQAVTCLLQSIKPLRLAEPDTFKAAVVGNDSLTKHRAELDAAIEALLPYLPPDQRLTTEQQKKLVELIQEGRDKYSSTDAIQKDGYKLYVAVEGAGEDLVQSVDQVVGKVNAAVLETEPDVQALSSVISNLKVVKPETQALKGGTVPPESKAKTSALQADVQSIRQEIADNQKDVEQASTALENVRPSLGAVVTKASNAASHAQTLAGQESAEGFNQEAIGHLMLAVELYQRASQPLVRARQQGEALQATAEALKSVSEVWDTLVMEMAQVVKKATIVQANVDAARVTLAPDMATCLGTVDATLQIKVIPEGDIELAPSQTRRIGVAGGKPGYTAKWLTDPVPKDSITVTPKMEGGSFYVELVAQANAAGGPYQLHITDTLNIGKIVNVSVKTTLSATPNKLPVHAAGAAQSIQVKGGDPEKYQYLKEGLGTVQLTFGPVDADKKGRPLVVTPGAAPQAGTILILDTSHPTEVVRIDVTVN